MLYKCVHYYFVIIMETGRCSFACLFLHLFVNVLLLILGMSLLGLGLAEESTQISVLLTSESKIGSISVVIGVILIVVTTINCCFVIDGSSIFYYIYAGILLLLFTAMVGLTIAYGPEVGTKVRRDIRTSMQDKMRYDSDGNGTTGLDLIQETYQCCGIDNFTEWYNVTEYPNIPRSCCIKVGCDTLILDNINKEDCISNIMHTVDSLFTKISAVSIIITIFLPIQAILVTFVLCYGENDPI